MALLDLKGFCGGYGALEILHGVDLSVEDKEVVGIIGPNGAGKTTLLKCIMGLATKQKGTLTVFGKAFGDGPAYGRAEAGVSYIPEGARVFAELTVLENLRMGGYLQRKDKRKMAENQQVVLSLFPVLEERLHLKAGTLSGGQRQMLAIGRGLMSGASLLLVDEPSLGLAPLLVDEVFEKLAQLRQLGATVLFVEQNAPKAFALADRIYTMSAGVIQGGECADTDAMKTSSVASLYLGGNQQ